MEEIKNVYLLNDELTERPIVILGTGKYAKKAFYSLLYEGVGIEYFADREKKLAGNWMLGKKIIHEDELIGKKYNVIVASTAWKDIVTRLKSKNINNIYTMFKYGVENEELHI